jgi:hypothetical protein
MIVITNIKDVDDSIDLEFNIGVACVDELAASTSSHEQPSIASGRSFSVQYSPTQHSAMYRPTNGA